MTEKDINGLLYQDSNAYRIGRKDGYDEIMSQMSDIIGKCYNTGYKDAMDFAIKYLQVELVVAQDEFGSDRVMTDYGTKEEFIEDFRNEMIENLCNETSN